MQDLVDAKWLKDHLGEVQPLDATFFLPTDERDANAEFEQAHIPGAVRFDLSTFAAPDDPAPHMLPSPALGSEMLETLGLRRDKPIVVYDDSPLRTAARGWFAMKHFGAPDVAILDGGLAAWKDAGGGLEEGPAPVRTGLWPESAPAMAVVSKGEVLAGDVAPVLDARGPDRFAGESPEPREGMEAGHIPGAKNLPYAWLYDEDGKWKRGEKLRAAFEKAGIDPEQPFTASCGSGVTACSLIFAAHLLGGDRTALYDGSWAEWGADPATPKARGAA